MCKHLSSLFFAFKCLIVKKQYQDLSIWSTQHSESTFTLSYSLICILRSGRRLYWWETLPFVLFFWSPVTSTEEVYEWRRVCNVFYQWLDSSASWNKMKIYINYYCLQHFLLLKLHKYSKSYALWCFLIKSQHWQRTQPLTLPQWPQSQNAG